MHSNSPILPAAIAACLCFFHTWTRADAAQLPGAREEISAAEYASLQDAMDALPPEGGIVRLPPGTFRLTEPLIIRHGDVRIEGAGTATHIQNTNTNGEPALIIRNEENREEPLWRVMLSHFRLTGNPDSGPGILAIQINEFFLQGVTVSYHGGHGVMLDACYEDPRINDCLITYNQQSGIQLDQCHDIVVCGNQFEENRDALVCRDSYNLCMTGNNLDDHLRHGIVIENTYGSVVSGNMIEECNDTAIVMDRDAYGNTLSANVIAHNGTGIDLRDAHGCAVSANTFTINQSAALRTGPECGRITIAGNNFSNSYIGNGKVKRAQGDLAAAGIILEATRNLVISGNLFSSLRPKGLDVHDQPSRGILFSNNLILDAPSGHPQLKDSQTRNNLILDSPGP